MVASEETEVSEVLIEDMNQDKSINANDALMILKAVAGLLQLTDMQKLVADVNTDGKINSTDALQILKYAAGLIPQFENFYIY